MFCFLLTSEKKRYNQRGKKKCLMVERTLLTKESHGSLASSQRSHERCGHSLQHSLNHVLPAAQHTSWALTPRASSSPRPNLALHCQQWLAGSHGRRRHCQKWCSWLWRAALSPDLPPRPWWWRGRWWRRVSEETQSHPLCSCGQKESLKVMTEHLRCVFSSQSAVAALALLPLPYLQALPVLLLPY